MTTRVVTAPVDAQLQSEHATLCLLVEMALDGGTLYASNAPHDVQWGGNTYIGIGVGGRIEEMKESAGLEVVGLRFAIAGPIAEYLSVAMQEPVRGRAVRLYTAFWQNGAVLADPVLEWEGRIDTLDVADASDNSEIIVNVESRFAAATRPRIRRHSLADHQQEYPDDTFYQHIANMVEKTIAWPSADWYRERGQQ